MNTLDRLCFYEDAIRGNRQPLNWVNAELAVIGLSIEPLDRFGITLSELEAAANKVREYRVSLEAATGSSLHQYSQQPDQGVLE